MKTTLNKIREHSPCNSGWEKLLKSLGKTKADDEILPFLTILESNGLDDTLWCCRSATEYDRDWRLYAVWCARQVQHLMTDQRSIDALDVAERYADGLATEGQLDAARDAAWYAARAAAWDAARDAAWAAWDAGDAAWDARDARDAAGDAARAAARAAWDAGDAAWDAARDAAWYAARAAAWDAAWYAARAAAWDAARDARDAAGDAARAAARAAWDAGDAAWDVAREKQSEMFVLMCEGKAPWQQRK